MAAALHTLAFVHANVYKDSVALMRVAQRLLALPGLRDASLQMGNAANKDILREAGLLSAQLDAAGPSDIMVAVRGDTRSACEAAVAECQAQLAGAAEKGAAGQGASEAVAPRSWAMALAAQPGANIAQISVPGPYAAAEALKALKQGLNVFMFSDNVPLAQEVALKQEARSRGLLVMGPDCGTAIIGGVPLGFANQVRRGNIGIVAASGTGLQEVTTQIHRMGGGVSHAIGTGGRDLYADVGGISMLQGIALLAADKSTRVIVLVSKPPAADIASKVLTALKATGKPAAVLFLGNVQSANTSVSSKLSFVHNLVDAAAAAVQLAGRAQAAVPRSYALPRKPKFAPSQKYLRALYSGGTFAAEAQVICASLGLQPLSNVPLHAAQTLPDARQASRGHSVLDLGDDAFTVGRPHPMIDQAARITRLLQEAADPAVRVILLDVVIGWGAHADPAAELAPAIVKAKASAARAGRHLAVLGFVCGTEQDPQGLAQQEAQLRAAGMVLAGNSANAAWLAAQWVK